MTVGRRGNETREQATYKDEITEELWANRKALLKNVTTYVDTIARDSEKRQGKTNREVVDRRLLEGKTK